MKDVKLFGLVIVGMVLLLSSTTQGSLDMETRLSNLEKRIESLEEKVESLLDFIPALIEASPPVTSGGSKSEVKQSGGGVLESGAFLFKSVTMSSSFDGIVNLKGEVLNQSGITHDSLVFFQVTLYNNDTGVIGSQSFLLSGLKDGQTKSFDVAVLGVDLDDIYDWKIEFDKGF